MLAPLAITLFLAVLPVPAALGATGPTADDAAKTPPPAASRWLGRLDAGEPGTFPPPRSFNANYRMSWGSLEAAHVETRCTSADGSGEIQLAVKLGTTGLARSLYTLDATHLSVVNRQTLHPIRLEQSETTSGGRRATARVDFVAGEAVRTGTHPPSKTARAPAGGEDPSKSKPRYYYYPGLYDMNSALLYLRSLPMKVGDEKTLALMTATSPYLVTIKVVGRGRVRVTAGEYPAIECSLALEKIDKNGEVEPRKGFKSAHAWLSDDADRLLIKVEAQVFVGTVDLELEKVNYAGAATR